MRAISANKLTPLMTQAHPVATMLAACGSARLRGHSRALDLQSYSRRAETRAIRGTYPADRKPFLFRSGFWLGGDYETTYQITTIDESQRPIRATRSHLRRRNDKLYRWLDPVATPRTVHPHCDCCVRDHSGRLDGGSWCCLGQTEPMRRRTVSSTA